MTATGGRRWTTKDCDTDDGTRSTSGNNNEVARTVRRTSTGTSWDSEFAGMRRLRWDLRAAQDVEEREEIGSGVTDHSYAKEKMLAPPVVRAEVSAPRAARELRQSLSKGVGMTSACTSVSEGRVTTLGRRMIMEGRETASDRTVALMGADVAPKKLVAVTVNTKMRLGGTSDAASWSVDMAETPGIALISD